MNHFIIKESCSTLRAIGREALQGKWKLVVLGMLVYQCAALLPQIVLNSFFPKAPGVGTLYLLLVSGPLTLGYSIFALNIFRKKQAKISHIFYGFEQFGKSLGVFLIICLIIMLWSLIAIPGVVLVAFAPFLFPVAIAACVPALIVSLRYEQAFFLLADSPHLQIFECIGKSKEMMSGNKMKLFLLDLSFVGWALLASIPMCVVVFSQVFSKVGYGSMTTSAEMLAMYQSYPSGGDWVLILLAMIPILWVYAYMMATEAGFYELLCGNLRPGVVQTTAEIIETTAQITQPVSQISQGENTDSENAAPGENTDFENAAPKENTAYEDEALGNSSTKINLDKDMNQ